MNTYNMSISAPADTPCLSVASFWKPQHLVWSAWVEHGPFAFWLVDAHRPKTIVELGTHNGYSFFALCQAVKTLGLSSACYAVDTWQGDEHAGFYGDEVHALVSAVRSRHYADIATLIRSTFDEALPYFANGSVDLLHIDGRHGYEDAKHDFETWRCKLSQRSIVLFHDINVRRDGFGVWKLWEELKTQGPSFEFVHGNGLGVLFTGTQMPDSVQALFDASKHPTAEAAVRIAYSRLGQAPGDAFEASRTIDHLKEACQAEQASGQALRAQLQQTEESRQSLTKQLEECKASFELKAGSASAAPHALGLAQEDAHAQLGLLQTEFDLQREELERLRVRLIRQRVMTEQQANEKFMWHQLVHTRHPLATWVDDWSRAHPRRARWAWRLMRAGNMVLKLQFVRLAQAARRRLRRSA